MKRLIALCLLVLACGAGTEQEALDGNTSNRERSRSEALATPSQDAPRHILLLTIDTLRADHLSYLGYPRTTTPYLDSLLASAVVFPHTLAPVPRTTPSLASLLTGAYPHTTGVRSLVDPLSQDMVSLAERLQQQGYRTVAVVSNHVLTPQRHLHRGFDIYDHADDGRHAAATTDAVFAHLKDLPRDSKLFLWVHYIDPHVPYLPPPQLLDELTDAAYDGPYRLGFGQQLGGTGDLAYPADLPKVQAVFRNSLPDAVNDHIRNLYAADVRATDEQVAHLLEGLRSRFRNDWSIIFTADHGEGLGEHNFFYDHGDYVYNPSLVVPLAFIPPPGKNSTTPRTITQWVSLVDVVPTLQDWFQLPAIDNRDQQEGRSLAPFLRGEDLPPQPIFAESGRSFYPQQVRRRQHFDVGGRFRTVIYDDWKLIWTPGHPEPFELYDLAHDPGETQDLYRPDHPQAIVLQNHLRDWMRRAKDKSNPASNRELTEDDKQRLRSLGYVP